jgi:sugar phosphate isomerase/epimerase
MLKFGSTTLPLAGWAADPRQPERSRQRRLAAIRRLVEGYGLSAVELTLDLGLVYPQVFDVSFYASVANLQQELGFVCTVHLPFLWVDLASPNDRIHRASLECIQQAIELTRAAQVQTCVLHLWGFTTTQIAAQLLHPEQRQAILAVLLARAGLSLDVLCELVDPMSLCVENLEDDLFDQAAPLLKRHGVSICLDVGHLAWQGSNTLDFLDQYGASIREIHLHDVATVSSGGLTQVRDHLALGQGALDYVTFLTKVDKSGFGGAVILEVNSQAELEESLQRLELLS